ncbi:Hyphally-regulated protein, partial [Candida africana]
MKVVSNFIFTILLTLNLSAALEVVTSRIDRGGIQGFHGDVKVHSGATWAILGTTLCSFFGGLEVEKGASVFIKLDNGPVLALNVALSTLVRPVINNGVISLNSKSSTSFSNFDIGGSSFTNNGEIYLASSGLVKSTAYLYAREWTNNGLIVAYQNQKAAGNIAFGTAYQTITNNGQICLRHQDFVPATKIKGTGCVTADEDTWIKLGNTILSVEPTHNFYLKDSKSSLIVHAVSSNQTFTVHGFGNGNKLGLTLPLTGNRDHFRFEYYPDTGILQLRAAALPQYFKIGKGYDSKLFRIVNLRGLKNAVTYDGPVPNNEIPAVCLIPCTNGPSAPESESDLNTPTTSSIETSSYSSAATESSVVSESSSAVDSLTSSSLSSKSESSEVVSSTTNIESSSTAIETTMNSESSTDAGSSSISQSESSSTAITSSSETSSSESMSASSTTASNTSIETDSGIVSQSESSSSALSSTEQSITSSPGQSTIYVNLTVTSTITNCDEVSCSQDVVTYTTNVPHTTVDATTTTATSTGGDNSVGGNESGSNHGPGNGSTEGSGNGSGAGSNEGSQSGPNNGSGSGSEGGSNNGSGSDSGSNNGSGSGSGSNNGSGSGSDSTEGSESGSGSNEGSGSGSGSQTGSGSGSNNGSGSGSQSGSESGSNSGSNEGSNPGAGNGSNEGSGQGSGNGSNDGSEAGSGQGSGPNNGSGSGHNDGSGSGSNQGSNSGAGSGSGSESGSESGSNAGSHSGSNEGAKTDSIEGFHTESKPGFNTGAHTDATVTGNSVANPVTTSTESDTTISVTVSITSYMTGFDGKPKPFTTVDVIPVPHSMPSNTTDSSSSVPTIDTNENGSSIVTGGKSILFGLIVSMVVLFM